MTWLDLVVLVAWLNGEGGTLSKEDADLILWEYTAFPFADPAYVAKQLTAYFRNPSFAIEEAGAWGDEL